MRFLSVSGFTALSLVACSPSGNAGTENFDTTAPTTSPSDEPAPRAFASTAWRTTAEDGARYTTQLDSDGTYRDLRNGDLWQTGSWTYSNDNESNHLCFTPQDDNGVERCWKPERMNGDTMRATSENGTEIELQRVVYTPPSEGTDGKE